MPAWGPTEYLLLSGLLMLIIASGFFSGAETALFGMSQSLRLHFRHSGTLSGRAVTALLSNQRMLLITILLGNMVINVLYFVISSVLVLRAEASLAIDLLIALASFLLLVVFGEVLPKIFANTRRSFFAQLVAPFLLTIHSLIGPVRILLNVFIVTPLSRLTAPRQAPVDLDESELRALLELSGREGTIEPDEQRMLKDVIRLGRLKVSDVMTPRVNLCAVPVGASYDDIVSVARESHLTKLPLYENNLDTIVGILHVKPFLIAHHAKVLVDLPEVDAPDFVPEMATLEQLLEHLRSSTRQSAIVVDEYGGTAGIVSIEDVVEEIVGDIVGADESSETLMTQISSDAWRVSGKIHLATWADSNDLTITDAHASTLGGFITERLGRAANVGDSIDVGTIRLEVERMEGSAITSIIARMNLNPGETDGNDTHGKETS